MHRRGVLPRPAGRLTAGAALLLAAAAAVPAAETGVHVREGTQEARSGGLRTEVIGRSVEGRPLQSYRFGSGPRTGIVFAGIHGGYEWNTILLARRFADYFQAHPREIPSTFTLYIIPVLNPDGLQAVTGGAPLAEFDFSRAAIARGRFNGRGVDLNRNFGATWEPDAYWGSREVDPGSAPFSEPETRALRDFVQRHDPEFVVSYHSAANGIYYGGRHERWEPSRRLARAYSRASGYPLPERGESLVNYEITGAAASYFYSLRIPAVTVELAGRSGPEFSRNLAGLRALLQAAAETEEVPPPAAGR